MRRRGGQETMPQWLVPFVETKFYGKCKTHERNCKSYPHKNGRHSEFCIRCSCNWFCIDCMGGAICNICKEESHHGHTVLQVRMASNQWAIRVEAVKDLMDTSGLSKYIINHHYIFFLTRSSLETNHQVITAMHTPYVCCEACGLKIDERGNTNGNARFCSLICKSKEVNNTSSSEVSQLDVEKKFHQEDDKQPMSQLKRQRELGFDGNDIPSEKDIPRKKRTPREMVAYVFNY